jgi:hypothetical protein
MRKSNRHSLTPPGRDPLKVQFPFSQIMNRFLNLTTTGCCALAIMLLLGIQQRSLAKEPLAYRAELTTASTGFDGKMCWIHARAGAIPPRARGNPSETPIVVMTLQKLQLDRSDVFYGLCDLRTDDLGKTWVGPTEHATLLRRKPREGVEVVPCDFWPAWHAQTGKLLGTGATFWYDSLRNNHVPDPPSETPYSVYDPVKRSWSEWKTLKMPDEPKFKFSRAGCTQRFDLPNGDILLPLYFWQPGAKTEKNISTICRCRFDGETLSYVEHGNEMTLDFGRGLAEPSMVQFGGRFFLTLRNDQRGYVTTSQDGMHFEPIRPWKFDDDAELGSYNTQQHWVVHSEGLYLVYTRRGADNDHVFRHRAPLFMARVDPERLTVLRSTERVLVPQRGAALGNFGVTIVSPDETWVVVTEVMHPATAVKHGSDNSVYVVKLHWNQANALALEQKSPTPPGPTP